MEDYGFNDKPRLEIIPANLAEAREVYKKQVRPWLQKAEEFSGLHSFGQNTERYLKRVHDALEQDKDKRGLFERADELRIIGSDLEKGKKPFIEYDQEKIKTKKDAVQQRQTLNKQILDYLQSEHGYFFGVLDNFEFSSSEQKHQLKQKIAAETARYINLKQGLPTVTIDQENTSVSRIARYLLEQTDSFSAVKDQVLTEGLSQESAPRTKDPELACQQQISELRREAETKAAIYLADPLIAQLQAHHWIRETYKEAQVGKRIFATPYFQEIIDFSRKIGDKENGIGGKIYYGPPGTGKTELAIEVNRQEGYKSRVVSVHYWTSFSQLFGEPMLQVKDESGFATQIEGLNAAASFFKELQQKGEAGAEEFWQMIQKLAEVQEKPLSPIEFAASLRLKDSEGQLILDPEFLSAESETSQEQKQALLNAYILDFGSKIMAIGQGKIKVDDVNDAYGWVRGEVLLAIDKGERVILDEVDKGSEHSLDSLSHLLATSPGVDFSLRDLSIKLPHWFRIDATANLLELGGRQKYFYDRFNPIFMDYPPAKDEMMLAGVWLADEGGNINLSEHQQYQIVGFFTIVLPRLRELYDQGKISQPISLRAIKELCNMIIQPKTRRARDVSLETAVDQLLFKQRGVAKDEEERQALKEVLDNFRPLFQRQAKLKKFEAQEKPVEQAEDLRRARAGALKASLENIEISPFLKAISQLPDTSLVDLKDRNLFLEDLRFYRMQLSEPDSKQAEAFLSQRTKPPALFDYQAAVERRDNQETGRIIIDQTVFLNSEGESVPVFRHFNNNSNFKAIRDISRDGNVILLDIDIDEKDKKGLLVYELAGQQNPKQIEQQIVPSSVRAELFPNGRGLSLFKADKGRLRLSFFPKITDTWETTNLNFSVKRYELSSDGRILLAEGADGKTYFFDLNKFMERRPYVINRQDAVEIYDAQNLALVGNRLVFQKGSSTFSLIEA
jgi:MoxR-like ATPase